MHGISCVEDFMGNCSTVENRNIFHVTASGALETSSQLCKANSTLRTGNLSEARAVNKGTYFKSF